MSDNVDNVLNSVSEATEPTDVVVEETPVASAETDVDEAIDETVEPVASASEAEEAPVDGAPVEEEPEPEPEPVSDPEPEPVSTQEVVQNVQDILSSTETNVTVDNSELEERVKVLEERLEKLIDYLNNRDRLRINIDF
jgi:chromatin segregation and condensation protein Rec8/ScpA/Scc1 (kleisin family)